MSRVAIVGCGYVGIRVARLHLDAGDHVTAFTTRQDPWERICDPRSRCAEALPRYQYKLLDLADDIAAVPPERFDVVHYHVPPPRDGGSDPRIARLLHDLAPPSRFIYLSATSVYGDHGGDWVDERTPPAPTTDRGRRRLDAEQQVREWGEAHGVTTVILRVAAIYGPGRLPRTMVAMRSENAYPSNRIHVDDLAATCFAAATHPEATGVYDCADGVPSTQAEYLAEFATLTGAPPPLLLGREEAASMMSGSALSFLREGKKIRADKLRGLGVELRYPDYRAGLRAIVSDPG